MNRSGKNKYQTPTALIHLVKTVDNQDNQPETSPNHQESRSPNLQIMVSRNPNWKIKNHQKPLRKSTIQPTAVKKTASINTNCKPIKEPPNLNQTLKYQEPTEIKTEALIPCKNYVSAQKSQPQHKISPSQPPLGEYLLLLIVSRRRVHNCVLTKQIQKKGNCPFRRIQFITLQESRIQ